MAPSKDKVYVGNLPKGVTKVELEREFENFGTIREVWIARQPAGFGFVTFQKPSDAEHAVMKMEGRMICGAECIVEMANNDSTSRPKKNIHREPARRERDLPPRHSFNRRSRSFTPPPQRRLLTPPRMRPPSPYSAMWPMLAGPPSLLDMPMMGRMQMVPPLMGMPRDYMDDTMGMYPPYGYSPYGHRNRSRSRSRSHRRHKSDYHRRRRSLSRHRSRHRSRDRY